MEIKFNVPFTTGNEIRYITDSISRKHFRGNGYYTKKCQDFFENRYGFRKCFLTTSCTDALEMASLILNIQPGDEVIVPSYGYYSTANAFLLRGAKIKFADSLNDNPNIDPKSIASLITTKTKAIVVIHYAGVPCDMDEIMKIANNNNIFVVEDAAQAIESKLNDRYLGTFGHLSTFSFHETKNIHSGEAGMLCINNEKFIEQAALFWEKGTNKLAFESGKVEKYSWKSVGSSFYPNEYTAAFLYSQLEEIEEISQHRKNIWNQYKTQLSNLNRLTSQAIGNAHGFYLICTNPSERNSFQKYMESKNIRVSIHYQALHKNSFLESNESNLPNAKVFSNSLIRLPFHLYLTNDEIKVITLEVKHFFKKK